MSRVSQPHTLSFDQQSAVDAFVDWWTFAQPITFTYPDGTHAATCKVFRLDGHAGTGKTSTVMRMIEAAGISDARFLAPTGKAASRLKAKGCTPASTIHRFLYRRRRNLSPLEEKRLETLKADHTREYTPEEHRLVWQNKAYVNREFPDWVAKYAPSGELLVIDEASMVHPIIGLDLLQLGIPLLVVGDSAQLQPVKGQAFFTNESTCDISASLTTVHRQKATSGVLRQATHIRTYGRLDYGALHVPDFTLLDPSQLAISHLTSADQIICALTEDKTFLDTWARLALGFTDVVHPGEKFTATVNNYDLGAFNGTQWTAIDADIENVGNREVITHVHLQSVDDANVVIRAPARVEFRDARRLGLPDTHPRPSQTYAAGMPFGFQYGYAMTCHKSQGSEWPNVLVIGSRNTYHRLGHSQAKAWWYTGITRAAQCVTVVPFLDRVGCGAARRIAKLVATNAEAA